MTRARDVANIDGLLTTTGDTYYASAAGTPARLGIGSTGQVATVAGGVPTWATPAAPAATSFSLLNSGGTSFSGTSTTISGISGINTLWIVVDGAGFTSANQEVKIRVNGDSGANYLWTGFFAQYYTTYSKDNFGQTASIADTAFRIGLTSGNANSTVSGGVMLFGCNSTGQKVMNAHGGANANGGQGHIAYQTIGRYNSASTISSVTVVGSGGTYNSGTVYVYGAA